MSIDMILKRVESPRADPLELLRVYRNDDESRAYWRVDPRLYRAFCRAMIEAGHPTRAFDLVREGLESHPKDQNLEYLGALALRRGGNTDRAGEYASKLLARTDIEPETRLETLSLLGSIAKERYARSSHSNPDFELARISARIYLQGYELARDSRRIGDRKQEIFPGINAATMSFLAGDTSIAKDVADSVLALAQSELKKPENARDYWILATIGEAMLLQGDLPEAAQWYQRAVGMAWSAGKVGDIMAMGRNFRLLHAKIPINEEIWGFFNVGNVVAFAGHMIDHPDRPSNREPTARFPDDPKLIERVEREIDLQLEALKARVGYCSVACGADILFAERMIERKAELHVILPFDLEDFYRTSVDLGLPANPGEIPTWRSRCDRILELATQVHHATLEKYLGDDILFGFANTFIQGLAILHAVQRGVEPFALTVLETPSGSEVREGGTADFLRRWKSQGLEARVIDIGKLREEVGATEPARVRPIIGGSTTTTRVRRKTMVMVFADVKNFSKLDDDRYPDFFSTFLDEVKRVIDAMDPQPVFVNTWGDGLYVVFERVVDGAEFALRLVDRVRRVDWAALKMPEDTTVRIGIHAGPVYQRMDPILGRENVFGSQVNRAARIEPVTTPGCVFASEQFAAALAVEGRKRFTCEYVGIEKLAKEYDQCPLYLLGRR